MFHINDIVFARLEGFPFWPARVITAESHHLTSLDTKTLPPNHLLVLFYNDNGRYAAVHTSDLCNFDSTSIRRETKDYLGPYKSQLRTAFKAALREYSHRNPTESKSPQPKPPPNKQTSSALTSPVTGHSESRQTVLPTKLTHRSTSAPASPLNPHRKADPTSHTSKQLQSSKQSPKVFASVPLHLRLKRKSSPSEHNFNSSPSNPSPQLPEKSSVQHVAKRRRLRKTDSDRDCYDETTTRHKPPTSDHNSNTNQPHKRPRPYVSEKVRANEKRNARITGQRERIPHLTHRKDARHSDKHHVRISDDTPAPQKSRLTRKEVRATASEQLSHESSSECDTDRRYQRRKRKTSSKRRRVKVDDGDVDGEPKRKDMRLASKPNVSAERPRKSIETQPTLEGQRLVKGRGTEKVVENRTSMESEQKMKSGKQEKTEGDSMGTLSPYHRLSKAECIAMIERMRMAQRCSNLELWYRGYKLANAKDIVKTEEGLIAACNSGMQKAEELLKLLKSGKEEKKEMLERETEAREACLVLRDVYFDKEKVSVKKVGKRILDVTKELSLYSQQVSTVLGDLLVMWADLTNEGYTQRQVTKVKKEEKEMIAEKGKEKDDEKSGDDSVGETEKGEATKRGAGKNEEEGDDYTEKRESEKRSAGKKSSTREERMLKFDRRTLFSALESVLKENERIVKMDSKEGARFVRRLEKEIGPTLEEDRKGYYEACVKVIRGIQKALKHLAVKGEQLEEKRSYRHTELFVKTLKDKSSHSMRVLVNKLTK